MSNTLEDRVLNQAATKLGFNKEDQTLTKAMDKTPPLKI